MVAGVLAVLSHLFIEFLLFLFLQISVVSCDLSNLPSGMLQDSFDVQHWVALCVRYLSDSKRLIMPALSPLCLESEEQLRVMPREAPSVLISTQKHYRKYLFEFEGQFISWGKEIWRAGEIQMQ